MYSTSRQHRGQLPPDGIVDEVTFVVEEGLGASGVQLRGWQDSRAGGGENLAHDALGEAGAPAAGGDSYDGDGLAGEDLDG